MGLTIAEFADGLRKLADWYEANPECPLPAIPLQNVQVQTKEHAQYIVRRVPAATKHYSDSMFSLTVMFGALPVEFVFWKSAVCQRIVKETIIIPAHTLPERLVPEEVKEVVEWKCVPILDDEEVVGT